MLYLLVKMMVFTTQGLILAAYGVQLLAEHLVLQGRIATLLGGLFKVSDVIGSYTKVQSNGKAELSHGTYP